MIGQPIPSKSGFKTALKKTITLERSDFTQSGSLYVAEKSITDLKDFLNNNPALITAYETKMTNYYTKGNIIHDCVSIPDNWSSITSFAFAIARPNIINYIAIDRQDPANLITLIVRITSDHYSDWGNWTGNQMIFNFYEI